MVFFHKPSSGVGKESENANTKDGGEHFRACSGFYFSGQAKAACRATVGAHVKLSDQNTKANQQVSLTAAPSLEQADEILARFGYSEKPVLATA